MWDEGTRDNINGGITATLSPYYCGKVSQITRKVPEILIQLDKFLEKALMQMRHIAHFYGMVMQVRHVAHFYGMEHHTK